MIASEKLGNTKINMICPNSCKHAFLPITRLSHIDENFALQISLVNSQIKMWLKFAARFLFWFGEEAGVRQ